MTDEESFLLASWIERARKAEAALTANGFVRWPGNRWERAGDPRVGSENVLGPRSAWGAMQEYAQVNAPMPEAVKRAQDEKQRQFEKTTSEILDALPPIDYDTRS